MSVTRTTLALADLLSLMKVMLKSKRLAVLFMLHRQGIRGKKYTTKWQKDFQLALVTDSNN
jgi:hypothetical protein